MMHLRYQKLRPDACDPVQGYPGDLGVDVCTPTAFEIAPGGSYQVDTGLRIRLPELPAAWVADFQLGCFVWAKSGLSARSNIETGAGVVDPNYTGSLRIQLYNHGTAPVVFAAGQKIAQLVLMVCPRLAGLQESDLSDWATVRGAQGFGSSGA